MNHIWNWVEETHGLHVPRHIRKFRGELETSWIKPRNFLRRYVQLGRDLYDQSEYIDAYLILDHALEIDSGYRCDAHIALIKVAYRLGRYFRIENLWRQFSQWNEPYLDWARVLCHCRLYREEDTYAMADYAIREHPTYAKLLAQNRKRDHYKIEKRYLTVGGKKEAREYWNLHGELWRDSPKAYEIVRARYKLYMKG